MWTVSQENYDWGHSWFIPDEDAARTLYDILAMNSAVGDTITLSHEGHIVDSYEEAEVSYSWMCGETETENAA